MNFLNNKKNWLPAFSWFSTLLLAIPLILFFTQYFSWPLFILGFFYSMVVLGTHGTIYYHRYSTHRAFEFSNPLVRFLLQNAVIRLIPEEVYVISHYVHHSKSEKPGDPYNVHAGWLYCFLADANHQQINQDMSPEFYERTKSLISTCGVHLNTYEQYQRWGSIAHPLHTAFSFIANWTFWALVFYSLGGMALVVALFGSAGVWSIGIRTFNYDGHGGGKDLRQEGIDFNRKDLSINKWWPGLITGEWHNNHHLYPNGARAGFLWYQFDLAWWVIYGLSKVGLVLNCNDPLPQFLTHYYIPYRKKLLARREINVADMEKVGA